MNRREFFQTSTLFLAGSVCAGASLRSAESTIPFRAQKIFLKSWDAENSWQQKLKNISRSRCNAVLLIPGGRSVSSVGIKKMVSEACRFDLKIFVPSPFTRDCFANTRTIIPLVYEKEILQSVASKPANNGGFLLLDRIGEVFGLVLYDSSRCLWTSFALPTVDFVQHTESSVNDARLLTAKWLDRVLQRAV